LLESRFSFGGRDVVAALDRAIERTGTPVSITIDHGTDDLRLIPVASLAVSSRGIFNQGELADEEAIYRRADHRAPA
jgi:hypothetical protein